MNLTLNPFTREDVQAAMFDPRAIRVAPRKISRFHKGGNRFYYYTPRPGEGVYQAYPSATTITKSQMPMGAGLLKWYGSMGYEQANAHKNDRAEYGTCMHMLIEKYLMGVLANDIANDERKISGQPLQPFVFYQDDLVSEVEHFALLNDLGHAWVTANVYELAKDLAAFHRFYLDHNVRPLLIETPLIHDELGYACTVDLVADIDLKEKGFWGETYKSGAKKGEPKETYQVNTRRVLINFKSGRKGSYDSTAVQLRLEQMAVEFNFPDDIDDIYSVYRWSPKEWKGSTPTYTLEDVSNKPVCKKTMHYIELANMEFENILSQPYKTSLLKLNFGSDEESSDVQIDEIPISEYLLMHHQETPEAAMTQPEEKGDSYE